MGDLRLAYEQRDGRNLVFALLPTGQAVWGMDAATHQEWWYSPELAQSVLPDLRAALVADQPTQPPLPARPGTDLTTHLPGHAVLAEIESKHRAATASVIDGMPGTLDDGIVAWCVGYVGETKVGAELARLSPTWRTLHAVPVGTRGSDIDHVVIGPGGVFTINTKHHAGVNVDVKGDSVFVGRDHQHYVPHARKDASRARDVLSTTNSDVPVQPLIVTVGAKLCIKQAPVDVTVVDVDALVPWLLSLPPVLTDSAVDATFEHLRWSGRWTVTPPPPAAAPWVEGFARQMAAEQAVAKATRRRGRVGTTPGSGTSAVSARSSASRRGSAPSRHRSFLPELLRIVVGLLLLLALVKLAPPLITAFSQSLTSPHPTSTAGSPHVATAGKACPTRGATATTSTGAPLACAPAKGSTRLVWRTPTG